MTQRGVKCFKLNTHLIEAIIFKTVLDRFRPRRIRLRNKNCQQILWHGLFKESTPGSVAVVWPQSLLWWKPQGWQNKILRAKQVTDWLLAVTPICVYSLNGFKLNFFNDIMLLLILFEILHTCFLQKIYNNCLMKIYLIFLIDCFFNKKYLYFSTSVNAS